MSSISTVTQQQVLMQGIECTPTITADQRSVELQRQRLMRSRSIDRIIQFNTYICSQNFFLLPALIAWLKTSQTVLQSHLERIIAFLKTLFVSSLLYRVFLDQLHTSLVFINSTKVDCLRKIYNSDFVPAAELFVMVARFYASYWTDRIQRRLFVLCVYATFVLIFLHLATCIYFLSRLFLPSGLIFLFVCLYLISHLNASVIFHYMRKQELRCLNENHRKDSKKFILGNKTISNFNLL